MSLWGPVKSCVLAWSLVARNGHLAGFRSHSQDIYVAPWCWVVRRASTWKRSPSAVGPPSGGVFPTCPQMASSLAISFTRAIPTALPYQGFLSSALYLKPKEGGAGIGQPCRCGGRGSPLHTPWLAVTLSLLCQTQTFRAGRGISQRCFNIAEDGLFGGSHTTDKEAPRSQ